MEINVNVSNHPLIEHKLGRLRSEDTDATEFRRLVRDLSFLLAYEATHDLPTDSYEVETPLESVMAKKVDDYAIGLIPVLRAGLGMVHPILELLPRAQVWHIGLYRDEETFEPVHYYNKLPANPTVERCLVLDPMLATGGSAVATVDTLKEWGVSDVRFVGIIGAPEGIEELNKSHPDVPVYLAAIDDHLNDNAFIVPGLGDAGDRQFGTI